MEQKVTELAAIQEATSIQTRDARERGMTGTLMLRAFQKGGNRGGSAFFITLS